MAPSTMTGRERVTAAIEGKETDRTPFSPFLAYVWESFPAEVQERGQIAFHEAIGADPLFRGAACPVRATAADVETTSNTEGDRILHTVTTPVGTLTATAMRSEEGETAFLVEHPLKTEEDYRIQLWIEEHTRVEYAPEAAEQFLAETGDRGLALGMLLPAGKSAYQRLVEHHAGTEELIYALMDFPGTVEALWEAMVANDLKAVRLAVQSGYDYFTTWEDSSTQNYSPDQYDRYIGAEIGQWCALLAAHGKKYVQHACGHMKALLPRLPEHGAHAVESLSPPPTGNVTLREARALVGDRLGIVGGIEPTEFLNRSLDELGPYVEEVLADGQGGPFLLANSDSCPPGVTVEKFRRVAEVAAAWKP
ncbi:MAG: uroporphyrinogen decarboxylase family protein [Planctomycetota bacterium]